MEETDFSFLKETGVIMKQNFIKISFTILIFFSTFLFSSSVSAAISPYPLFGQNPQHTGQSEFSGPQTNEIKWISDLSKIYSRANIAPVISSNGTIYFIRNKGIVYAVNPNGTLKWEKDLNQSINSKSPAIGIDGTIYLGTDKGNLIALNQEDGSIKWTYSTPSQEWIPSAPTISIINEQETIYFGSPDNNLYAIDSHGNLKWTFPTNNFIDNSPAISQDGTIYFGSADQYLYALNPDSTLKWKFDLENSTASSPAIDENGIIYIGTGTGGGKAKFYAINPNGSEKWNYEHTNRIGSPSIDELNQTVYLPVDGSYNQSKLIALNKENGELKWEYETNSDAGWFFSKLAIDKDGTIYGGREYLYAVNPNGELKWKYDKWTESYLSPAIGKDGTLYVPYRESGSGWTGNPIYQLVAFGREQIDNTPPQISNISIEPNKLKPNQPSIIKAKITDKSEIISVKAILSSLGQVFLFDNGESLDETANDGIYTVQWTISEGTNLGEYTLTIVAEDEFENQAIDNSESFEVVSTISEQKQKELIEDYFPYWKFSQGEEYHPTGFYFDNDADVENNRENYEIKKGDWAKPYVYAHTVEDNNYFTIQYWMYMAFNEHPVWFDHEHDFDATIFVIFDKNNLNQPIEVRFARHWSMGICPWSRVVKKDTTHSVVYVAEGSHGGYHSEDMGYFDIFNPGGLTYSPNFFNYYKVGNCIEQTTKEINGEQREFCLLENKLLKGEAQNEPIDGYWPNQFGNPAPWKSEDAALPWFKDRWNQTRPTGIINQIKFEVACPVDLHIYDPQGRHIGINYQTNEPEIQIPEAIFQQQGEKQYIMIPNPIKGDYQVEIVGTDNGEYDFTMIASEDMKLIEKQEKKNIPVVKDEIQTFTVLGLWESPKEIKEKAIDDLESIENDNRIIQKNIQKAISLINKSLNQNFWINDTHLDKKQGGKVFNYELRAVARLKLLEKISKKLKINDPDLFSSFEKVENRLAKADYLLAETAIDEAKNTEVKNDRFKKRIEKIIKKAEKELKKAKQDLENDKPIKSIIHSKRSWSYSQMAMRLAEIPNRSKKNK